jgi:hypothetical protein
MKVSLFDCGPQQERLLKRLKFDADSPGLQQSAGSIACPEGSGNPAAGKSDHDVIRYCPPNKFVSRQKRVGESVASD